MPRGCTTQPSAGGSLPIGSGSVKASAKHLVQARMERAGSRWSDPGACAILDLRAMSLADVHSTPSPDFLSNLVRPALCLLRFLARRATNVLAPLRPWASVLSGPGRRD